MTRLRSTVLCMFLLADTALHAAPAPLPAGDKDYRLLADTGSPDQCFAIDCVCTTDPKRVGASAWTVRFRDAWDVARGRLTEASCKRLSRKPLF